MFNTERLSVIREPAVCYDHELDRKGYAARVRVRFDRHRIALYGQAIDTDAVAVCIGKGKALIVKRPGSADILPVVADRCVVAPRMSGDNHTIRVRSECLADHRFSAAQKRHA